jgi:Tfp pilus assembly protein PilF
MTRYRRLQYGSITGALGLALLAGCIHSKEGSGSLSLLGNWDGSGKQLTASQTADMKIAIGRSLEKRGESEQAMAAYLEAVKQDPGRGDAYLRLGILSDKQGKFAESESWYRKALAAQPGSPDIFSNMGYSLYLQRRFADAEMNFRQALALNADHRRAHNNLGMVLARAGRGDEALVEFRRGGCKLPEAHLNAAFALTLERKWPQAHFHYEAALAADPSSTSAKKGLEKLEALMDKAGSSPQRSTSADNSSEPSRTAAASSPAPSLALPDDGGSQAVQQVGAVEQWKPKTTSSR